MTDPTNTFDPLPDEPENSAPEDATPETTSEPAPLEPDTSVDTLRTFEQQTLAETMGQFFRAPRTTWTLVTAVAGTPARTRGRVRVGTVGRAASRPLPPVPVAETPRPRPVTSPAVDRPTDVQPLERATFHDVVRLGLYVVAFLLALFGSVRLVSGRTPDGFLPFTEASVGTPFLLAAFVVGAIAEGYGAMMRRRATDTPQPQRFTFEATLVGVRPILLVLGGLLAGVAFVANGLNQFTIIGVAGWFGSIVLVALALMPRDWHFVDWAAGIWPRTRAFVLANRWSLLALLAITAFGAFFRFQNLIAVPPEMTSDHVEKLLDTARILNGETDVFFANNGGREPFQFYMLATLVSFGFPLDFFTLKFLAVIEGILAIPVFWWLGREMVGERDHHLGNVVGLAMALLLAMGYWHNIVGRVSLRIIVLPLVTAVLLIFLTRALRHNRRNDFIASGLLLGLALYTYQASRMLPVVIVIAVAVAMLIQAQGWAQRRALAANFVVLVVMSFIVFVPLFRFSIDQPLEFWSRTSGRLVNEDGSPIPTDEALAIFADNMGDALLMFNYRGDSIYLHNAPQYPAMHPITGALLILGAAAWLVWSVRRRDAAAWLIPITLLVMLLPSALAIAIPGENPSFTRASGAMPSAYLFAAFGLGSIGLVVMRMLPGHIGKGLIAVVFVGLGAVLYVGNSGTINGPYYRQYIQTWHPISDAGKVVADFAENDGGYGNAFVLASAHWLDWRGVAFEAGVQPTDWRNGDIPITFLPDRLSGALQRPDDFQLDVNRDILILYALNDLEAENALLGWFPEGEIRVIDSYIDGKDFKTFRVPAPGVDRFQDFLDVTVGS